LLYCKDAREIFLEKESVDLFVSHLPYYGSDQTIEDYGNSEKQIHNGTAEEYVDNIIQIIKHMEYALKATGSILMGVPAKPILYKVIHKIVSEIGLQLHPALIWSFGNEAQFKNHSNTQVYFLHMTKESPRRHTLSNLVVDLPWTHDVELDKIQGYTFDAVPRRLCDIIVEKFSDEGDTVADLLGGTGTVAASARNLKRNFIYNDVSEEQYEIAQKRLGITDISVAREETMLTKEEVIKKMVDIAEQNNLEAMQSANLDDAQIEQMMEQVRPQLENIQGQIYDALVEAGALNV
jgi:DNA modification methylase